MDRRIVLKWMLDANIPGARKVGPQNPKPPPTTKMTSPAPSGSTQILAAQLLLNLLGFIFHARQSGG